MKHLRLTYLFLTLLLALMSASCKDDSLFVPVAEEESGSGVYVSVVVNTEGGNASRVGQPTPGEKGDDEQAGVGEENKVHDLTLFFLNGTLNDATEICASAYFDEDDITPTASGSITRYTVQREIEGLFVGNKYHVVAIVNAGDLTNGITDIDGLKNYQFREVIVTHGSERWFLMASEKDSDEIEIRANNSQYNPTWVNVDVERMTARVDCAWKWKEFYEITGENMPSEGEEQNPGEKDKVKILGAALVNRYRSDTYAFKRVTDGTNLTAIDYLGDEKTNADGIASNYVLDPKTISGKNSSDYTFYYTEYVNWDVENDFINPITGSVSVTSGGDRTYYLLDYVRENINTVPRLSEAEGVERYATGIMFKAQYTPAGFAEGETFYVYPNRNGERTIYTENELRKDFPEFDDLNKELWDDSFPNLEIYTDGVCYYIYWIRHADDSDTYRISPMEYAIVRNNIYQLYVNSISALGNPEPDSHIEEVTSEIHVNVKNWTDVDVTVPVFD